MIRNMMAAVVALAFVVITLPAQADYATTPQPFPGRPHHPVRPYPPQPYPGQPYYPPQPVPNYPMPLPYYGPYVGPAVSYVPTYPTVMCYAQGLGNGAIFYGIGMNYYAAQQWAMYACNSSGQYCQITGCR